MTLEEIRELIQVVRETGVAELEVQRGDNRVKIRLHAEVSRPEIATAVPVPVVAAASEATPPAADSAPPEPFSDPSLIYVKAPIVGTFYEAPSPDTGPFVNDGDTVRPGQVLCIIESMKLMNEIESEVSGVVVKRFVENTHPVEYGESLFAIKPF
jgi:acetyl-CoA carboxylase biotin carboxyl carrier protein